MSSPSYERPEWPRVGHSQRLTSWDKGHALGFLSGAGGSYLFIFGSYSCRLGLGGQTAIVTGQLVSERAQLLRARV